MVKAITVSDVTRVSIEMCESRRSGIAFLLSTAASAANALPIIAFHDSFREFTHNYHQFELEAFGFYLYAPRSLTKNKIICLFVV